jgi:hypothetical protein
MAEFSRHDWLGLLFGFAYLGTLVIFSRLRGLFLFCFLSIRTKHYDGAATEIGGRRVEGGLGRSCGGASSEGLSSVEPGIFSTRRW